ncbi:MAG: PQQ-binding-like beta-propeller repeat protein [Candidatus Eisenbacteria bacterium]|nr:PQQ-binding-like beta-propeller repeat protein [Candidatus Eisenbacteria bacterium]
MLLLGCLLAVLMRGTVAAEGAEPPPRPGQRPPGVLIAVWKKDLGRHVGRQIDADAEHVAAATLDRRCVLLDARSGREIWSRRRDAGVQAGLTLIEGAVLGVTDFPEGRLFCLARVSGRERWSVPLGEAWGAPLVADGRVFAASLPGRVACVSLEDGRELWHQRTHLRVRAPLALCDSLLLVPTLNDSLLALDAASGARRWSVAPGGALYGPPVWTGTQLWTLSFEGRLSALDPGKGRIRASRQLDGLFRSGLAARGDRLAALATDGTLWMLDAENGDLLWRAELGTAADLPPALDDETVWVGLLDGSVHAFRAADGRPLSCLRVDPPVAARIAIAPPLHLISGGRGTLAAYQWSGRGAPRRDTGRSLSGHRTSLRARSAPRRGWPRGLAVSLAAHHLGEAPEIFARAARRDESRVGKRRGWLRWVTLVGWVAGAGAALWLQHEADQAYDQYLHTGDPRERERQIDRAERLDRGALGAWIGSEGFFLLGLWAWLRES